MELKGMKLVSKMYTTIGFCQMEISALRLIFRISLPMGRKVVEETRIVPLIEFPFKRMISVLFDRF